MDSVHKTTTIENTKVFEDTNYQRLRKMKMDNLGEQQDILIPEYIHEIRYGYANSLLQAYVKDKLTSGASINLRGDVRNDYLWENIHKLLLSMIGSLLKVLVFDPSWRTRNN